MSRPKAEMDFRDVLSKRLSDELEKRKDKNPKYTQKDLAEDLGIDASTISKYLSKDRQTSVESLYKISEALDCSIEWLVRDDVPRSRKPSKEENHMSMIAEKTGFSLDTIQKILMFSDEEKEFIECLVNAHSFIYLLKQLIKFFNFNRYHNDYAFVYVEEEEISENGKMIFPAGILDDHAIPIEEYEQIKLSSISKTIKSIKDDSLYHVRILENEIKLVDGMLQSKVIEEGFRKMLLNYKSTYEDMLEDLKKRRKIYGEK